MCVCVGVSVCLCLYVYLFVFVCLCVGVGVGVGVYTCVCVCVRVCCLLGVLTLERGEEGRERHSKLFLVTITIEKRQHASRSTLKGRDGSAKVIVVEG